REPRGRAADKQNFRIFPRVESLAREQQFQEQVAFVQHAAGGEALALEIPDGADLLACDETVRRRVVPRPDTDDIAALLTDEIKLRRRAVDVIGAAGNQGIDVDPAVGNHDRLHDQIPNGRINVNALISGGTDY